MRPFLHFLSIVGLLSALAACGTKGPLYLPKKPAPPAKTTAPQTAPADDSTASGSAR